jgi:hypothetical protein
MTTVAVQPTRVALSAIVVGENVGELDEAHVDALARSIAWRGLIVPLPVRPKGDLYVARRSLIAPSRERVTACSPSSPEISPRKDIVVGARAPARAD